MNVLNFADFVLLVFINSFVVVCEMHKMLVLPNH